MTAPPAPGDPITVVIPVYGTLRLEHVKRVVVDAPYAASFGFIAYAVHEHRSGEGFLSMENEGITWCRGHDGPAVAALEVSVVLTGADDSTDITHTPL